MPCDLMANFVELQLWSKQSLNSSWTILFAFKLIPSGKIWTPLTAMGRIVSLLFFCKDGFDIE